MKKLSCRRETLRALTAADLDAVVGGTLVVFTQVALICQGLQLEPTRVLTNPVAIVDPEPQPWVVGR